MKTAVSEYKIIKNPSEDVWARFLSGSPHGTVFHTPEMIDVFRNTKNHWADCFAAEKDGRIMAMLHPVLITLKSGWLQSITTRSIHYGGPLYTEDTQGLEALAFLINQYIHGFHQEALFTDFRMLTDPALIRSQLENSGWVREPHINYWIRMDSEPEKIMEKFHKSARRNARQAEKKGVSFHEIRDPESIPEFYDILRRTFSIKNTPLPDISFFVNVHRSLAPKNYAKFFFAEADGKNFGAFLVLLYKETIYLFYSADNFEMRNYYPTDGFIWHILQWGHHNGYRIFDFGWAGRIDQPYGVRQFKEKFGGELIEFGRFVYVHKPVLLKLSKIGYQALQLMGPLKKRLPGKS